MTKAGRRFAVQALIQIITLAGFWIACAATVHIHEMIVGIGAVILSVAFCLYVIRTLPVQFDPKVSEILQVIRIPWSIVMDLVQLTLALLYDLIGHRTPSLFRSVPWSYVDNNGPETARRVLAIAYTTVSPNCIAIGVDCGRGQFLFHQVQADRLPSYTRMLGAEDPQ